MFDWIKKIEVSHVLWTLSGIILFQQFLREVLGINMLGKRIYKGAPLLWKVLMKRSIARKELINKVDEIHTKIHDELSFNGGHTTKDVVKRIDLSMGILTQMFKEIKVDVDYNKIRLDIMDELSERMLFRLDSEGSCVWVNDTFLKIFGYTWSDVEGFRWENLIHEDDIHEVREKWIMAIKRKERYSNEQRILNSMNEVRNCKVVGYPVMYADGTLRGFYGTVDFI